MRFLCFWFFLINSTSIQSLFGQGPYQKVFVDYQPGGFNYLDSLASVLDRTHNQTLRLGLLNDLAYYWHTRDLIKADSIAQVALFEARTAELTYQEALIQISHAAILLRKESLLEAEVILESAMKVLNKKDWSLALTQLEYIAERRGELSRAAEIANENLKLSQEFGDLWGKAMALSDICNLYWKQSNPEGLEFGLLSINEFKKRGILDLDFSFTYYVLANQFVSMGQPLQALLYLDSSIYIAEKYGFYNNLSDAYIARLELYTNTNEFEKANESFVQSLQYANLLKSAFMQMRTLLYQGRMLNKKGDFFRALEALDESLEIATAEFDDDYWLMLVHEQLGLTYAGLSDYKKAYEANKRFIEYKQKVQSKEVQDKLNELQTFYETSQNEATINEQRSKLNRQNIALFSVLALFIVGLVGGLLLVRFNQRLSGLNNKLLQSNKEKDFLLKEIHHRVKNNLQILSSLLNLQSEYVKDDNARTTLSESRNRVESMGLIHQRLYTGGNAAAVEMRDYIVELVQHLKNSLVSEKQEVKCELDIRVGLIDVDTAIPLGLIVNELITNSIKYAFSRDRAAIIQIGLGLNKDKQLVLSVKDNGDQSKKGSIEMNATSFGSALIAMLSKKLKGRISINASDGYQVTIAFNKFTLYQNERIRIDPVDI